MTRDEILAALDDAGIEHDKRWGKERLAALLPSAEGEAPAPEPAPATKATDRIVVRCIVPNVWTDDGKLRNGECGEVTYGEFMTKLHGKVERL